MLSRVAESIYWMSRYIERAENVARFIDVTLNMIPDMPPGSVAQWQPLVDFLAVMPETNHLLLIEAGAEKEFALGDDHDCRSRRGS